MTKDRSPISPQEAQTSILNARTFIDTGSVFGDNFRFTASGLGKIAKLSEEGKIQVIKDLLSEDWAEKDIETLYMMEKIFAQRIIAQMDANEALGFIEQYRDQLSMLDVDDEKRDELLARKDEEFNEYNQGLEAIASALLGMNIALWSRD